MTLKEKFYGKELWRTINLLIIFLLYGLIFVVLTMFPEQMWNIFTGVGFVLLVYLVFWQYYLRKMDQERRGKKLNAGWIDHRDGVGEEYHFVIAETQPIDRLPKKDLEAADVFQSIYTKKAKQQKLLKTGFDEFKVPEQKKLENKEDGELEDEI